MARVIQPPAPFSDLRVPSVFLAGSIEMGRAEQWQREIAAALDDLDVVLLNPRRDDWDPTWEQRADNPPFREQVEWELAALEHADHVAVYFDPNTQSPVTLIELGLFARSGKLVVCCPAGFWRKGNVDVVCERYGLGTAATLSELAAALRQRLSG